MTATSTVSIRRPYLRPTVGVLKELGGDARSGGAKRQAKKAATLGFRVEAINHLRTVLSDIDRAGITSRTVDTIHDAMRSTELVFSRDVRERLHRASATIFRLNTLVARGKAQYPQDIVGLIDELQTLLTQMRQEGTL
jgi:hypothetical protein